MVRRLSAASLDSGSESPEYGESPPLAAGRGARDARVPWGGSGGRWAVWPVRAVLWATILIIGYRGVMAIALNETVSGGAAGNAAATSGGGAAAVSFPVALGEAFAERFGQLYLNFSPSTATERAQQLAAFIPANIRATDPQFGWSGSGTSTVQSLQLAGIDVRDGQTAVVTLLATVNNRLMELGVPLYASDGRLVVSGEPAWLPAPPAAVLPAAAPGAPQGSSDPAALQALKSQLPGFFQAYAASDQTALGRYLAPGVSLSGLGGAVSYGSIASMSVPAGGVTRHITVTVNWVLPGQGGVSAPQLATTYDMSVVDQQSQKWYVKDIRASTQPMGTP